MKFIELRNFAFKTAILCIAFILSFFPILVSCNDNHESANGTQPPADTNSFTFFELGKTTRLTKSVRNNLIKQLGRDAVQRRNILDLEINYPGFLNRYFPELEALNRKLNFPPRERVEHNTVKLMYRYAQKKNVPFELVELVFSDYTDVPILFKINFKIDEANIVDALREKYGNPEIIDWEEENGSSMFWKKNGDLLVVSLIPDQFGKHEHQIVIYFIDNLIELIETERLEKEAKEQQREETGKRAF
jgi:hypothetical protein